MHDDKNNDGADATLAALLQTPVGRRWLLKAGLGAAVAAAVGGLPGGIAAAAEAAAALPRAVARPRPIRRTIHFALGRPAPRHRLTRLKVVVNGKKYPISAHTNETRIALRSKGSLWRKLKVSQLTHFATIQQPADRASILTVYATRRGKQVLVAQSLLVPPAATLALARLAFQGSGHYGAVAGHPDRLAALGLRLQRLTSPREIVDLDSLCDTYDTAATLASLHPNVATIDGTHAGPTKALLKSMAEVKNLGQTIQQMQGQGQDFATLNPAVDASGQPSQLTIGTKTMPFSTVQLNQTNPTFTANARTAFVAGIKGVRNTGDLGTVLSKPLDESPKDTLTWHQPEGISAAGLAGRLGGTATVNVENPGLLHGTYTYPTGPLGADRTLPLKLYNNYVRWVWVYVQYLKADGTNLSATDNPTWPDTRYAKSLGLLPQIFTVLGIPLWDTNTIEATLNFPPEATSARILFCGLGNTGVDGGWRQYFPKDAYPDHIAPQDEVLFASLATGLLTIGVTAFALLADIDSTTIWAAAKKIPYKRGGLDAYEDFLDLVKPGSRFTQAETFATTVAAGAATTADIAGNGGDLRNIWNTLLSLGSIIPKLLFEPQSAPLWGELATEIVLAVATEKAAEAVPLIGEIIGVVMAVGDAATLAEAIGETASSPWIIKNQVSLGYPATVTVSPDSTVGHWPFTATQWRLDCTIDGAVVPNSTTGTVNPGGHIQSEPVVVNLNAPFGGTTITWSLVVQDANGHQVGAGSVRLANNDPSNTPSTVQFAIKEVPAAITPATVFKRADTTTYSEAAGGYTWSNAVTDTGTRLNAPLIQEVSGVTIATRLNVAGVVWKLNDKYYLRCVPVVENGSTITLGTASKQGYVRRPYLLFDALVGAADAANHVLLEPDDQTDGYHVRALAVDPKTGNLSWDSTVSLGYFPLPVSAAALHASGHVVAIHTNTGRLARVRPAATPRPPLAAYSAGNGTTIGLLSTPIAVAVTAAGTVLVLETGPQQLAAFDLNGNPVRHFGSTTPAAFTLALPAAYTYLDLAVDGAGMIYLLYYQGDGSQPSQYRIDVYSPGGDPIVTQSAGTNVPHLAVDYWRSIFAANFTPLLDGTTGQPRVDPLLKVAEPSLSRFDPS